MRLTRELAQDILLTRTVDPSRLHDLMTRGSNATEQTQGAAARLRRSWEGATLRTRTELRDAQEAEDLYRIQLAQIALAEQDEDWREEMMQHTQTVMIKVRETRRRNVEILRERHVRDRAWTMFWHTARAQYIRIEQERWRQRRREWIRLGIKMQQRGCSEVRMRKVDEIIERIAGYEAEVPDDKKSCKILSRASHAECREEESREAYLIACRRLE